MFTTRIKTLQALVEAARPPVDGVATEEQFKAAYASWSALAANAHQMARALAEFEGTDSIWNEDEFEEERSLGDTKVMVSFRTDGDYCEADTVLINGNWCEVESVIPWDIARRWNDEMTAKHQDEQAQAKYEASQVEEEYA